MTADEARKWFLQATLDDLGLLIYRADQLDSLNEGIPTSPTLTTLGYARHRDELIQHRPTVWAELSDEAKCFIIFMPEEDIKQLTLAAIDVVLQHYDETAYEEVP
ncbi:hypothetical protein [Mycobacterium europaeum]|nr:hypothetical protein [Mycobacterium europaeum]